MSNTIHTVTAEPKLWTKSFMIMTMSNFLLSLNLLMITPSLPAYVADTYQAGSLTVSLVVSLFALSAIVTRLFAGRSFERFKPMTFLWIGLAIYSLSTGAYGIVPSLLLFMGVRIIYGIGFGMTSTAVGTLVTRVIPPLRMGEGMGFFGLANSLAMALGPIVGLWLLGQFGYQTLIVTAFILVIIVFPLLLNLKSSEPVGSPKPTKSGSSGPWMDRKALLPCLLNWLMTITYGGILTFITMFGKEAGIGNVGMFFLFNALAILVVRIFSGKLYDRFGHLAIVPAGCVLFGTGLLLLSWSHSTSMLIMAACVYGLGYGALQPALQAWTVQRVAVERRAAATGAFYNSVDLGVAVGSLLLGAVAMMTNYAMMYRISALSAICMLLVYGGYLWKTRRVSAVNSDESVSA
ncbi:MFS transporter [Paenibacillus sp. UMB4589-SE434]|uniref:MFS transporter n=1 Tax=Paenibacillus sp. UMB4589-SE434 TaxID=3046314 RepID=UPI00254EBC8A|nr:MFS transporter [Paenibacillus sp. UMB4589-SE434]MDK8182222.1 MFS transporter [Paenibacillus sp. UMB4589-SE434]